MVENCSFISLSKSILHMLVSFRFSHVFHKLPSTSIVRAILVENLFGSLIAT